MYIKWFLSIFFFYFLFIYLNMNNKWIFCFIFYSFLFFSPPSLFFYSSKQSLIVLDNMDNLSAVHWSNDNRIRMAYWIHWKLTSFFSFGPIARLIRARRHAVQSDVASNLQRVVFQRLTSSSSLSLPNRSCPTFGKDTSPNLIS